MWMTDYVKAVQRGLIEQHGFAEDPEWPSMPLSVPDGKYPMTINGRLDAVVVRGGYIDCCNFEVAD